MFISTNKTTFIYYHDDNIIYLYVKITFAYILYKMFQYWFEQKIRGRRHQYARIKCWIDNVPEYVKNHVNAPDQKYNEEKEKTRINAYNYMKKT